MGKRSLCLSVLTIFSVINSAFGRRITFKLRAQDLRDLDTTNGHNPGADAYAEVFLNDVLQKQIGRNEGYTYNTAKVDWTDAFSITVQKGDKIRIDIKDVNRDLEDTWHGSVNVYADDLENVGMHRYRIVDLENRGVQSGYLFLDVHAIKWSEKSPC